MDQRKEILIRVLITERKVPISVADIEAALVALDTGMAQPSKDNQVASFSERDLREAVARGRQASKLAKGIARLKPVRLKPDHPENCPEYLLSQGVDIGDHCAILGEWGDTRHYLVLNVTRNSLLPGTFHLDRFEEIPEDDL